MFPCSPEYFTLSPLFPIYKFKTSIFHKDYSVIIHRQDFKKILRNGLKRRYLLIFSMWFDWTQIVDNKILISALHFNTVILNLIIFFSPGEWSSLFQLVVYSYAAESWPFFLHKLNYVKYFLIGHFRVGFCLCVKTSLRTKPFIWKRVLSHPNQPHSHTNRFCTRSRLKKRHMLT